MTVTFGLATTERLLDGPELHVANGNAGDLLELSAAMTPTTTAGFSPTSIYATWTSDQRAAADRAEADFNRAQRCGRLAELVHTAYIRVATDDSVRRLATQYRLELEGIQSGDLAGGRQRARQTRIRLTDVEREQQIRAALAESWLAREDGTHCYTAYEARGGLEAVAYYGAPAPSYELAVQLDRLNWRCGLPHVLTWTA